MDRRSIIKAFQRFNQIGSGNIDPFDTLGTGDSGGSNVEPIEEEPDDGPFGGTSGLADTAGDITGDIGDVTDPGEFDTGDAEESFEEEEANVSVTGIRILDSEPEPGGTADVEVTLRNSGGAAGIESFSGTVNGSPFTTVTENVGAGATTTTTISAPVPDDATSMEVCVGSRCTTVSIQAQFDPEAVSPAGCTSSGPSSYPGDVEGELTVSNGNEQSAEVTVEFELAGANDTLPLGRETATIGGTDRERVSTSRQVPDGRSAQQFRSDFGANPAVNARIVDVSEGGGSNVTVQYGMV